MRRSKLGNKRNGRAVGKHYDGFLHFSNVNTDKFLGERLEILMSQFHGVMGYGIIVHFDTQYRILRPYVGGGGRGRGNYGTFLGCHLFFEIFLQGRTVRGCFGGAGRTLHH